METSSSPAGSRGVDSIALPTLAEQRDLAERMAVGERLARVLAHDLNNVFQSLLVNLQFAETAAEGNPGVLSDVRDAQRTTERALAIAKQLKLFTRSHSLSLIDIDLPSWLERHRDHLSRRANHAIAIGIRQTDRSGGLLVRADGATLLDIMERLVDNALEAMPGGGTLLLTVGPVTVPEAYRAEHPHHPPEHMIMLEVRDTGPGMEPEVLHHAFEPYYSARSDARESGYGLAFVYAAIRKMNGFADIESTPGEGTAVRLFLPAVDDFAAMKTPAGLAEVREERRRETDSQIPARGILIVESDAIVREVAARCLAREGYPIFEAADGESAIEKYRGHSDEIALVILEFALPRRSGLEVQTAIRAISPQQRFLFSSSFNSDLSIDAIAEDPRIQLIPKPFTRADLLNTVELMIGRP